MKDILPIDLSKKTVFVLGAGASKPYDLPLATELKSTITIYLANINQLNAITKNKFEQSLANDFILALKRTYHPTIDVFLEKKTKFREIGAYAIAYTLLRQEKPDLLFSKIDWYSHIFDVLNFENDKPNTKDIVFVTLNYDRSLECFFHGAIEYNLSDKLNEHTRQKLTNLKIIHAHGSLGHYPEVPYGVNPNASGILENAAKGIRITSDRLENTDDFRNAQAAIREAVNLVFIGFGYDPTTLNLLTQDMDLSNKRVFGTVFNISDSTRNYLLDVFKSNIEKGNAIVSDPRLNAYMFVKSFLNIPKQN